MRFEWDEENGCRTWQSTAAISFMPRTFSMEGAGSTLSLLVAGAQDFKHWRAGRRDDRRGLDAARRGRLQDYFGEEGEG